MPLIRKIADLIKARRFGEAIELLGPVPADSGSWTPPEVSLRLEALVGAGRWREAIDLGSSFLRLGAKWDDKRSVGEVHGRLGTAYLRIGAFREAEAHLRAAYHVLRWDVGDIPSAITQQKRLAVFYIGQVRWQQAWAELQTAISSAEELDLNREVLGLKINLAVLSLKSGDLATARATLAEARELALAVGEPKLSVLLDLASARYSLLNGHVRSAAELAHAALNQAGEMGYSREEAIALEYLGDCRLAESKWGPALEDYSRALAIAESTAPEGDIVPELCHRMAEAHLATGDHNAALVLCERGLRIARATLDRYEECATHRVLAMAQRASGNPSRALRTADEGIEIGRQYHLPYELALTLTWAGTRRLESGDPEEQAVGRRQLWEAHSVFARMDLARDTREVERLLGFDPEPAAPAADGVEGDPDLHPDSLRFGIVTCSDKVIGAFEILKRGAPSQIPVLITGESGVGKELMAQALHRMSPRRKAPFIAVNCGAISAGLLESEFFGHERGAFTGAISSREGILASANAGTLFLDEIGNLPLQMQAALLRVLETGELRAVGSDDVQRVDVRIVAATNASVEELIERGSFRRDLFYRINGIRVSVPPLREREEDVIVLFRHFWAQAAASAKKRLKVDERVEGFLCSYGWPGNVRELRHEVARAVALAPDGSTVGPDAFLTQLKSRDVGALRRERNLQEEALGERRQIITALRAHRGNKAEAARSLGGMKRTTLIYKIERLRIRPEEYLEIE